MSRKVFTAGEVLAAADVNSFLMDQTVMSFAGTAARGSAIPSPTTGMYTHLEDTPPRTQFWNGSAWVSPFGTTLVGSSVFTSQTSVTLNNVFSAAYDAYIVRISITPSNNSQLSYTLVNGATPAASNFGWNGVQFYQSGTQANQFALSGQSAVFTLSMSAGSYSNFSINVNDPFLTRHTFFQETSQTWFNGAGNNVANWINSRLGNDTSYEGFRMSVNTGTMTGTIRIYGLRNS
jgi:hypothetical protein